jgi:hypothetical protein
MDHCQPGVAPLGWIASGDRLVEVVPPGRAGIPFQDPVPIPACLVIHEEHPALVVVSGVLPDRHEDPAGRPESRHDGVEDQAADGDGILEGGHGGNVDGRSLRCLPPHSVETGDHHHLRLGPSCARGEEDGEREDRHSPTTNDLGHFAPSIIRAIRQPIRRRIDGTGFDYPPDDLGTGARSSEAAIRGSTRRLASGAVHAPLRIRSHCPPLPQPPERRSGSALAP